MKRFISWSLGHRIRAMIAVFALLGLGSGLEHYFGSKMVSATSSVIPDSIPNNQPQKNPGGKAATFSTQGAVNLTGEYFQAQGTNGRSCASCHTAADAWSINPGTLQDMFDQTAGKHPVFNKLDANNPDTLTDDATTEERLAAFSMVLSRGVFRRGGTPRPNSEWELIAVEDPHGYANLNRIVQWRRAMPTINFPVGSATVNWDGGNSIGTDQHAGLVNQANRNVTGGQQGPPATAEVIADIVNFEEWLCTAQLVVPGGRET
jgi:cytochrome c peroxidase